MLYSNNDMNPTTYASATGRIDWIFFTTVHEVGHLLGLGLIEGKEWMVARLQDAPSH
jgi:hypothetical protein